MYYISISWFALYLVFRYFWEFQTTDIVVIMVNETTEGVVMRRWQWQQ